MRWPLLIFFWSGGSSSHPVRSFTNQRPLEALGAGIGHGKRGGRSGRPGGIAPALVNSVSLRVAPNTSSYVYCGRSRRVFVTANVERRALAAEKKSQLKKCWGKREGSSV